MKESQDNQGATEEQQHSHESHAVDSASNLTGDNNKKVSREDIELVQNLIERCLLMYMNKSEVVRILLTRARIEPGFTTLVWQKLEEENTEFFKAYYVRLKLKKQILLFNNLLEHQYHIMKYPAPPKVAMPPMQNGVHPIPASNLPMGYPVLQRPPIAATAPPHMDPMRLPNCHVVNGFPAPAGFHPVRAHAVNGEMMGENGPTVTAAGGSCGGGDMVVSPASAGSSGQFPFTTAEMSGMGMDAFTAEVGGKEEMQLGFDGDGSSKDGLQSGVQLPWTFSLADLTADLTNLEDLGDLGSYTGSPFLHESDIMLDPDHADIVEDFFVDNVNGPSSQSDEEKT